MNPYKPHLDAFAEKIAREKEAEVTVTLKGKHISALRALLFAEIQGNPHHDLVISELDRILYDAHQKI
jgi:hypothetical protein